MRAPTVASVLAEALGPDAPLMADANRGYTLGHTHHLADLDAYRLLMIAQPLAQDDLRRHKDPPESGS